MVHPSKAKFPKEPSFPPKLGFYSIMRLVWRLEVRPRKALPFRELTWVDAQRGIVLLHFNQVDAVLNKTVYDNTNVRSEDLVVIGRDDF